MKKYTIIGGVNGVGKSSLTGVLKSRLDDLGVIVDVDKLTAANGGDPLIGGRIALKKISDCLSKGICFTQETTLSGKRTLHTIRTARKSGYSVQLYYIGLNTADDSIQRIANRVFKGGHDIPAEDVRRRFENRLSALLTVLPYCDEATFFDNDNGFVEVGIYRNGELTPTAANLPQWFCDIMAAIR